MLAGKYPASISTLQAGVHLTTSTQLSKPQRAGIFRRMGDTYEKMSEYDHAIEHLNRAWEILGNPEDSAAQEEAAHIFSRMAWSLFHSGNLNKAKEVVLLAINFAEWSDNLGALAVAENYLGGICMRQGDLEQSARHTRLALSCWEKIGYTWGMANTLNNLGILAVISGDVRAALSNFESSLKLRRDLGDVEGLAIAYNNLGLFVAEQGDFEQAQEYLRKSLVLTRSLRMPYHTVTAFTRLAHVLICLGRLEEAAEQIGYGRILVQTANPLDINMELTIAEADLNLALEEYQEAERIALQAEQLAIKAGDELELSAALRIMVQCRIEGHDPDAAQGLLDRARQAAKTGGGDLALGRVEALAVRLALLNGDVVAAAKHYALAEEIFENVNAQFDLAQLKPAKR